jgi:hypothetical protein
MKVPMYNNKPKQNNKKSLETGPNKRFLWFSLFLLGWAGCGEKLRHIPMKPMDLQDTAVVQEILPSQIPSEEENADAGTARLDKTPGLLPEEQDRTGIQRPFAVPMTYRLIPDPDRESVFDTLLGPKQNAYFLQERLGETFTVFSEEGIPVRMAQARRLGGKEGSILILLGMSVFPTGASIEKVYTFEKGTAASVKPYQAGKDNFLKQFQDHRVFEKSGKIQGITGATPVWKPVAEQIQDIRETLLKEKADAEWLAAIKNRGSLWHRSGTVVAEPAKSDTESVTEEVSILQPMADPVSIVQDSNLPYPLADEAMQADSVFEASAELSEAAILADHSPNAILYEYRQAVAAAETSLLICGLLIVTTAQIKRITYK